jgi:hypothetical protein
MKKGRPAIVVSTLAMMDGREAIERVLFDNSTTLGVRSYTVSRSAMARQFIIVTTRFGDVRLKLRILDGRVVDATPEYDDCANLARRHERPFMEVWEEARRMGDRFAGLEANSPMLRS